MQVLANLARGTLPVITDSPHLSSLTARFASPTQRHNIEILRSAFLDILLVMPLHPHKYSSRPPIQATQSSARCKYNTCEELSIQSDAPHDLPVLSRRLNRILLILRMQGI
jgi:hypothetical protein